MVRAATFFDIDGDGPEPSRLYVAGQFTHGGGTYCPIAAWWDGDAWQPVGFEELYPDATTIPSSLWGVALAAWEDENGPCLLIACDIQPPGPLLTTPVHEIWRLDSSGLHIEHSAIWGGTMKRVSAFAVHDDGAGPRLFAMESTRLITGVPDPGRILVRDNGAWSLYSIAPTYPLNWQYGLASIDDGDGPALWIAGSFGNPLSTPSHIAKVTGPGPDDLEFPGRGLQYFGNAVASYDPDGEGPLAPSVVVGGEFNRVKQADGSQLPARFVANWDGTLWHSMGAGTPRAVQSFFVERGTSGDDLFATTALRQELALECSRTEVNGVFRFDAATEEWSPVGIGFGHFSGGQGYFGHPLGGSVPVMFLTEIKVFGLLRDPADPTAPLIAHGIIVSADGAPAGGIAVLDGTILKGDADRNKRVDMDDLLAVLTEWGVVYCARSASGQITDYRNCPVSTGLGDANFDGVVDFDDIVSVLGEWGRFCE